VIERKALVQQDEGAAQDEKLEKGTSSAAPQQLSHIAAMAIAAKL
jgi:hypothetical protein